MKLIIISHPAGIPDEPEIINALFDHGLEIFHVRKPGFTLKDTIDLLLHIKSEHRAKLVMHDHHAIAEKIGTKRIHFSEEKRLYTAGHEFKQLRAKQYILSTSVHSVAGYAQLESYFQYAFLGPVFDSISKPEYKASEQFKLDSIVKTTQVIAIGGITPDKLKAISAAQFDGAALMGAIWKNPHHALKVFNDARHA